MKNFGQKIKERREQLGLSQEAVAGKVMATRTLQRLEDGDGNPTLSTILEIAAALKVSAGDLISDPAPPPAIRPQSEPKWPELARLVQYYGEAELDMRLLGLYMLSENPDYIDQYAKIDREHGTDAAVLKRILATS